MERMDLTRANPTVISVGREETISIRCVCSFVLVQNSGEHLVGHRSGEHIVSHQHRLRLAIGS